MIAVIRMLSCCGLILLFGVNESSCQVKIKEDSIYFLNVDKTPEFRGGVEKMYKFINKKNKVASYDETTGEDETATVIVSFVVERNGRLSDIQLQGKGYKYKYNKEALRIVKSMPKWRPAILNGEKVRCEKIILVIFHRLGKSPSWRGAV